jgi:hypothetical protein
MGPDPLEEEGRRRHLPWRVIAMAAGSLALGMPLGLLVGGLAEALGAGIRQAEHIALATGVTLVWAGQLAAFRRGWQVLAPGRRLFNRTMIVTGTLVVLLPLVVLLLALSWRAQAG